MANLELRNVSFSFPDGTEALSGINLIISEGGRVSVVGPNGAGKSTLLLILAGLRKPGKGKVLFDGVELSRTMESRKQTGVGVVFQDPDDQVFMPTVEEDVAFGPTNMGLAEAEIARRVEESLKATGLEGFGGRSPHHLSVGEMKRVAIAGILAMSPGIILLDEPTSGLDPKGKDDIMQLIDGMKGTVVLVTHDMDLAMEFSDRIVLLRKSVLFDGGAAALFRKKDLLESAGLRQPKLQRISDALRRRGFLHETDDPRTVDELEAILLREKKSR